MSVSRKFDVQRVKNTLKAKSTGRSSSSSTGNGNPQQLNSAAGLYTGDTPYHYDAIAVPMMKLSKKASRPDVRTVSAQKEQVPSSPTVWSAVDVNGHSPNTGAPLPPPPHTSTSNGEPRSWSPPSYSQDFDLAPPPPNRDLTTIDGLSERLFSDEHLYLILRDPTHFVRFTSFVNRHRPQTAPMLKRYLETQKAIKAIEYANAVAQTIQALPQDHSSFVPCAAAMLDGRFEARSKRAFEALVNDGLSAYVTRVLVDAVTDTMVKEITGNTLPVMRDLVGGLAEVFCLTDPSLKDNPIVYASEEFYRTTQYGRDYVIGRNCRFLQGPKTHRPTIARISAALNKGEEICETVLNYRRDGSPFLNLLMIAPLYDNRGSVRYFIGAQVDVTRLVEEGRGIDSFERLLAEERTKAEIEASPDNNGSEANAPKKPIEVLGDLGEMLSWEETQELQTRSRSVSFCDDAASIHSVAQTQNGRIAMRPGGRRILGAEHEEGMEEKISWGLSGSGLSGRLPGVYQNYLLVRPSPSLRIIFVSPALRIPGLLQSRFLSRIGGSDSIRDGIKDAFAAGVPVTAKVAWLPHGRPSSSDDLRDNASSDGSENEYAVSAGPRHVDREAREREVSSWYSNGGNRHGVPEAQAKARWLSCTPLLGSDDRVGVWMVVMVEDPHPDRVIGVRAASAATHARQHSHSTTNTNGTSHIIDTARPLTSPTPMPHPSNAQRSKPRAGPPLHSPTTTTLPAHPSPPPSDALTHRSPTLPRSTPLYTAAPKALAQQPPPLLHASATARGLRSPGSWSPTLSPAAVESWIPTGYGGGVLSPMGGGRGFAEFGRRGREGGVVGGGEG